MVSRKNICKTMLEILQTNVPWILFCIQWVFKRKCVWGKLPLSYWNWLWEGNISQWIGQKCYFVITQQKVFMIFLQPENEPQNRDLEDKLFLYMTLQLRILKTSLPASLLKTIWLLVLLELQFFVITPCKINNFQ